MQPELAITLWHLCGSHVQQIILFIVSTTFYNFRGQVCSKGVLCYCLHSALGPIRFLTWQNLFGICTACSSKEIVSMCLHFRSAKIMFIPIGTCNVNSMRNQTPLVSDKTSWSVDVSLKLLTPWPRRAYLASMCGVVELFVRKLVRSSISMWPGIFDKQVYGRAKIALSMQWSFLDMDCILT